MDDDVHIEEFADEIDPWIIDELKKIGLNTAKGVLQTTKEALKKQTRLETETIEAVLSGV